MCPVSLYDELHITVRDRPGIELRVDRGHLPRHVQGTTREDVPEGPENIVVRTLELLGRRCGIEPSITVRLSKRIPAAAGLGGGSSDAAGALLAANSVWGLSWPVSKLAKIAAEIGSDVPFFLFGGAALCRGRGELIEPVSGLRRLHFVLACPRNGASTAEVYRNCVPASNPRTVSQSIAALRRFDVRALPALLFNRLEEATRRISPWPDQLRTEFSRLDFVAHQMSGSGTSYFGLCRNAWHARRLLGCLKARPVGSVYAAQSCS
jgi:4-diphosphocytidyl-2-C-methyl-D-erythritol kinase